VCRVVTHNLKILAVGVAHCLSALTYLFWLGQLCNIASMLCSPLHKAPVALNRYDDETTADSYSHSYPQHYTSPSKVRGKARALYHFHAQTKR